MDYATRVTRLLAVQLLNDGDAFIVDANASDRPVATWQESDLLPARHEHQALEIVEQVTPAYPIPPIVRKDVEIPPRSDIPFTPREDATIDERERTQIIKGEIVERSTDTDSPSTVAVALNALAIGVNAVASKRDMNRSKETYNLWKNRAGTVPGPPAYLDANGVAMASHMEQPIRKRGMPPNPPGNPPCEWCEQVGSFNYTGEVFVTNNHYLERNMIALVCLGHAELAQNSVLARGAKLIIVPFVPPPSRRAISA